MKYGICILGVSPVFRKPEAWGELVNQLLFGETFEVLEQQGNFAKIRSPHDHYEGWIDHRQAEAIDFEEFTSLTERTHAIITDVAAVVVRQGCEFPVVRGGSLPQDEDGSFKIGSQEYRFGGTSFKPPQGPINSAQLVNIARSYLNCPYQWGGRSPFGIDCSGFVQIVFKCFGVHINRDAWQQAEQGEEISDPHDVRMGDVATFKSIDGRIYHAGLLLSQDRIIHASSQVRIDRFDPKGIYSEREQRYTHNLLSIRRMAEVV